MLPNRQQVLGAGSAWNRNDLVMILVVLVAIPCVGGCHGPLPRSEDWSGEPIEPLAELTLKGSPEQPQPADPQLHRKRGLRIHMNADPGSLNPLSEPTEWGRRITMDNVFETLVRYRPGAEPGPGLYQEGLARAWVVSPGGREIRIDLHENARWNDGKAVTALDVQFSLDAARSKRGGSDHYRRALEDMTAVEIINRHQVRLRLARANAFVLRNLASVPILPEHIYLKRITQSSGSWIGSGPYRVSSQTDNGVVLERNPEYWGALPAIEHVEYVREQDAALALRDAKEGQIDIVPELIVSHYPEQLDAPGMSQKFSMLELQPATFSYVVLNTLHSPFDDTATRRAIALLIDREALIEAAGGLARSVSGPVWPGGPGDGVAAGEPVYSLQEATQLLDQAGWRDDDGDGVRARGGQRLMITVLATEATSAVRELVLASLRKAGFVLDVRVGSAAVLRNRLDAREFDLAFASWSGDFDRDLSPLLASQGRFNYGGYHSPVVDELLEEIRNAYQPEQRAPIVARLARVLVSSVPLVALPAQHPRGLVHRRVKGLRAWNGWFTLRELEQEDP